MSEASEAAEAAAAATPGRERGSSHGEVYDEAAAAPGAVAAAASASVQPGGTTSFHTAVAYVVGTCVGSGIYSSPGKVVVTTGSGGAAAVVWVLAGLVAIAGGLCYAEVGMRFRERQGGEVMYIRELWGDVAGFCYTWVNSLVTRPAILALVCNIFGQNFNAAFGLRNDGGYLTKLPGVAGLLVLAGLNTYSATAAARAMRHLTIIKVGCLVAVFLLCIPFVVWYPEASADDAQQNGTHVFVHSLGFEGTSSALSDWGEAFLNCLWAYDGWNLISYIIVDMRSQHKSQAAIVVGLGAVIGLYVAVTAAYNVMLPRAEAESDTILLEYLGKAFGEKNRRLGHGVAAVVVAISTFGSGNGCIYAASRIVQNGGASGYLPAVFGEECSFGTPANALLLNTVIGTLCILFVDFSSLLIYFGSASFCFYTAVAAGLIKERLSDPRRSRLLAGTLGSETRRTPLAVPCIFIVFSLILIISPLFSRPAPTLLSYAAIVVGVPVFYVLPCVRRCTSWLRCCVFVETGAAEGTASPVDEQHEELQEVIEAASEPAERCSEISSVGNLSSSQCTAVI